MSLAHSLLADFAESDMSITDPQQLKGFSNDTKRNEAIFSCFQNQVAQAL